MCLLFYVVGDISIMLLLPPTADKIPDDTDSTAKPSTGGGCDTGCIIGIVMAILGAAILAAVVAGVAYAIYSYLKNPDTKLNKLDPNGING